MCEIIFRQIKEYIYEFMKVFAVLGYWTLVHFRPEKG